MKVRFIQEVTISALERRVFEDEVAEVDESLVDLLVTTGIAVIEKEVEATPVEETPRFIRRGKRDAEAAG